MSRQAASAARKRVTLSDIALHIGVSAITVSRALRSPDKVSPAIREKVCHAVEELGYIPNRMASALASARTRVVGVSVPSLTNIVFNDVISAIYDVLLPRNYQVLLGNSHYSPQEEQRLIETLIAQGAEAMIVTGLDQTQQARRLLERAGLPVVQIMETGAEAIDLSVGFSQVDAGFDMTCHLLDAGYREVAFMGARMDPRTCRRMEGYKKAMEERGRVWRDKVVTTPQHSSVKLGADLLRELLSSNPKVDAVFCCNDDLAMGVIFEAQRAGLSIPGRLAVAGFNDLEAASSINPSLTTVATPRYAIGRTAAERLLARLEGEKAEAEGAAVGPASIDLGYRIVKRAST